MALSDLFSWGSSAPVNEMPDIFPFPFLQTDFVSIDLTNIYARILTDVLERTQGVPEEKENLLWDNCIASESSDGLVTLVSKAMSEKRDLYLVYRKDLNIIRKANPNEEATIRVDYEKLGKSSSGVYITFKNYRRTDMLKLYSWLEYCTVASLSKSMNLAKAIQLKMSDLRGSVSLVDKADVQAQALAIAEGLAAGKDILVDAKDVVETAKPDLTATNSAMEFINQKRSFYLGLPASYITGLAPKGLGDSGMGDAKAVERGLKGYYFAIAKPILEAIFGIKTTFKSEDFEQITTSNETLKTFELTGEELLSMDNKRVIINKLYGLPETEKGDAPEKKELADPAPGPSKVEPRAVPRE